VDAVIDAEDALVEYGAPLPVGELAFMLAVLPPVARNSFTTSASYFSPPTEYSFPTAINPRCSRLNFFSNARAFSWTYKRIFDAASNQPSHGVTV
jgi:hypothetical protein